MTAKRKRFFLALALYLSALIAAFYINRKLRYDFIIEDGKIHASLHLKLRDSADEISVLLKNSDCSVKAFVNAISSIGQDYAVNHSGFIRVHYDSDRVFLIPYNEQPDLNLKEVDRVISLDMKISRDAISELPARITFEFKENDGINRILSILREVDKTKEKKVWFVEAGN